MSNQLDTRDLQEELEELESLQSDHELAKETLIEITQAEAFAPIYVRLAYAPT